MSLVATRKDRLYTAVTAVVLAGAVLLGFVIVNSGGGGHTVYARFANAQFIVPGNTVHINGVTAGKISTLTLNKARDQAIVKMSLTKGNWPIHTDATAAVRPVSILGEQYVDINPGSASAPAMANGATIPQARTRSATNLQSVLDAVNDPTATALSLFVTSLGQGMAGQGQNAANAIRALSPALTNTNGLLKLLDGQNQLITQMIDNVNPVLHALDTNQGATLDHLFTTTNGLLGATAASSNNIGTDLRELPSTLQSATSAFNQLGGLADQATPALASITPLTNNLQSVSQELLNFSAAANPAVSSLQPLLGQAKTLIDKARPVVDVLKTEGPTGLSDLQATQPIIHANVADLHNFFRFIAEWASTTGNYDGTSHFFRFHAQADCVAVPINNPLCAPTVTPQGAKPAAPAKAAPAARPAAAPAARPAAPANPVAGLLPNILNAPSQILGNLLGGLGGLLGQPTPPAQPNSATGLNPNQEQNLIGYLLGGL